MRNFKETVYYVESINGHMDDLNSDLNENLGKLNEATGLGLILVNQVRLGVLVTKPLYIAVCDIRECSEGQYGHSRHLGTARVYN